ncbi:hypothetical protein ACFQ0O_20470 [Saccharopolyspora spinosporotrichia]
MVAHFALGGRRERFVLLRPDSYVAAAGGRPTSPPHDRCSTT